MNTYGVPAAQAPSDHIIHITKAITIIIVITIRGPGNLVRLRAQGVRLRRGAGAVEWGRAVCLLWKRSWRGGRVVAQGARYVTASYYSALHVYEYDLPGMVTVRPLHGTGWRGCLLAEIRRNEWSGAVRYRPMMLTAMAVVIGAAVILTDPIFQGLAISLMAGGIAALFVSLPTVPVLYYIVNRRKYEKLEHAEAETEIHNEEKTES